MRITRTRIWAGATLLGVLAAGCARPANPPAPQVAAGLAGTSTPSLTPGFTFACAPGQRTLIRQVVSDGQPMTEVRCVPDEPVPGAPVGTTPDSAIPAATAGEVATRRAAPSTTMGDQVNTWAPATPRPGVRTAAYRTDGDILTYQPRSPQRARTGRTWQKSAVIIGSSAGVGAGVGAAIGGKKGAVIGAAIGGGSAAIWDQATRRR